MGVRSTPKRERRGFAAANRSSPAPCTFADSNRLPSTHRLQRGLRGYLIPFAPHAFAPQRQSNSRKLPSPTDSLPTSMDATPLLETEAILSYSLASQSPPELLWQGSSLSPTFRDGGVGGCGIRANPTSNRLPRGRIWLGRHSPGCGKGFKRAPFTALLPRQTKEPG